MPDYIHGHNARGRKLSEKAKRNLSKIHKGKKLSKERLEKLQEGHKKYLETHGHPMLGKHHSKKTKELMSKNRLQRYPNGWRVWHHGKTSDPTKPNYDSRIKSGKEHFMYGTYLTEETKEKLRKKALTPKRIKLSIKNLPKTPSGKDHHFYGKHHTEETKQKLREARIKQKMITSKTKPEMDFMRICEQYNLPFRYVGDGEFWLSGINPDFINKERKIALEVFGDYWHNPDNVDLNEVQTEEGRTAFLEKCGWTPIIIWESELNENDDEYIVSKVIEVVDGI